MHFQRSLLSNYVATIIDGQEARKEIIRIAQKNPSQILESFRNLPSRQQKYFGWLHRIATEALRKQRVNHG